MPTAQETIAFALRASHQILHRSVADLQPHEYEAQPVPGANCLSWILGHLVLTERRILSRFGVELPPLPDGFEGRFPVTKQPAGEQKGFGDPAELVRLFDAHRNLLIDAVERATDEQLAKPLANPNPLLSTQGNVAHFMAHHVCLHAGQATVIRRALGYPPVM